MTYAATLASRTPTPATYGVIARIVPPIDVGTILMISPYVAGVGVLLASVAAYVTLRLYVRL